MSINGIDTTVVLTRTNTGLPYISYWGPNHTNAAVIQIKDENLSSQKPQLLGAGLEHPEFPSLLPTQAEAWTGKPLISIARHGSETYPKFQLDNLTANHHTNTLTITASDSSAELTLTITLQVHHGGLISQQASLQNNGEPLTVNHLWLTFPLPSSATEILTHTGHHMRERAPQRQPLTDGFHAQESWTGRPDFHTSLIIAAGTPGFNWETGRCYSAHVGWSGNHTHFITRTPYSTALIGGGELLQTGEITLQTGETYTTPRVYASWGNNLNQLAHRHHTYLRDLHGRPLQRKRPITLNIWEAVYFNQNETKLKNLATLAAKVGVERFVVDDGWFKGRRDDTKALGDWQIDYEIWPNGLKPLADHVHQLNLEFGLWFEPEMISLNSDLARNHPDWILRANADRLPLSGRDQYVLDLANPAASQYLYENISTLVKENNIDYIKWDHNRFVTEATSPYTGKPAVHSQVSALYQLIDKLRKNHPNLEIESCASGGGRVDLGILSRTHRIWTSDCTDPIERIDIQAGTSLLVPPEMMGAHVASSPSHITRRQTNVHTRVAAAFLEHFGVEWNLLDVAETELTQLTNWITTLNQWRDYPGTAKLYHAAIADSALRLDGLISEDETQGIYRFCALNTSARYPYDLVRLPGLNSEATYQIQILGPANLLEESGNPMVRGAAECWWNQTDPAAKTSYATLRITGAQASEWGIRLPALAPENIILLGVTQLTTPPGATANAQTDGQ